MAGWLAHVPAAHLPTRPPTHTPTHTLGANPPLQDRHWPALVHVYDGGDRCELADGVTKQRTAEVRYACSPDADPHLLVREPDFCEYVVVVYSPGLCQLKAYQPLPRARSRRVGAGGDMSGTLREAVLAVELAAAQRQRQQGAAAAGQGEGEEDERSSQQAAVS